MQTIEYITSFFSQFGYVGVFFLLFVTAASPIFFFPEEIVLVTLGAAIGNIVMVDTGILNPIWTALICYLALILADSVLYGFGRFGIRKVLHRFPNRVQKMKQGLTKGERLFSNYGWITIFITRVVPGPRTYLYMSAGFFQQSFLVFTGINTIAIVLHVTFYLVIGYIFAEQIHAVFEWIIQGGTIVYVIVGVFVVALIGYFIYKRFYLRPKKSQPLDKQEDADSSN